MPSRCSGASRSHTSTASATLVTLNLTANARIGVEGGEALLRAVQAREDNVDGTEVNSTIRHIHVKETAMPMSMSKMLKDVLEFNFAETKKRSEVRSPVIRGFPLYFVLAFQLMFAHVITTAR